MSTKVNKLKKMYNMRLNNATKAIERMDKFLPRTYTSEIISRVKKFNGAVVSDQSVRDVKRLQLKDPVVLRFILEFAKENEKKHKDLEKLCE